MNEFHNALKRAREATLSAEVDSAKHNARALREIIDALWELPQLLKEQTGDSK